MTNFSRESLFQKIDCIQLYIPDLDEGVDYYCNKLGLMIIWKSESSIGLGMNNGITELVIQNERKYQEIDIKVNSVIDSIEIIKKAGGSIVSGPFEIKIGNCAVVRDPWDNQYVILDSTKGTFITDKHGNILEQKVKQEKKVTKCQK
jgi:predicted enzyme related to lactoylglutathione lyase